MCCSALKQFLLLPAFWLGLFFFFLIQKDWRVLGRGKRLILCLTERRQYKIQDHIFAFNFYLQLLFCMSSDSGQPGLHTPNGPMQSAPGLCSIPKKPYKHSSWINFHLGVKVFVPPQSMQRMSLLIIRFGDVGRRPCAPISCILVSILLRELLHLSKGATVSTGQFIKSKKKTYDFSVF